MILQNFIQEISGGPIPENRPDLVGYRLNRENVMNVTTVWKRIFPDNSEQTGQPDFCIRTMRWIWVMNALFLLIVPRSFCQEVRIGLDEWPPFASNTLNLPQQGLSVEILTKIFKEAGYTPKFQITSWPRVVKGLKSGTFDAIGNLWFTEPISKWVFYSAPYHHSDLKFIVSKKKTITYDTIQDLKPYTIGIGIGYTTNTEFDTAKDLKKVEIPLSALGMEMIQRGRLDMVLDSEEVFLYLLSHDFRENAADFQILEKELIPSPIYLGAAKKNSAGQKLINDFNSALDRLTRQGIIREITERHFRALEISK